MDELIYSIKGWFLYAYIHSVVHDYAKLRSQLSLKICIKSSELLLTSLKKADMVDAFILAFLMVFTKSRRGPGCRCMEDYIL